MLLKIQLSIFLVAHDLIDVVSDQSLAKP